MTSRWGARITAVSKSFALEPSAKVEAAIRRILNEERVLLDDSVITDWAVKISHGFTITP